MTNPPNENIAVVRGDDADKIIEFLNNDDPLDFSNFDDVWFTVLEKWSTVGTPVFVARLTEGGLVPGNTAQQLRLPLPRAETATWGKDQYVYYVRVLASEKVITTQRGWIHVIPDASSAST